MTSSTWLATAIEHAQCAFSHARNLSAQHRSEWEIGVLLEWQQLPLLVPATLIRDKIHPLKACLRRQFDAVRTHEEGELIEWKLKRLSDWERHLNEPTVTHPRLRF